MSACETAASRKAPDAPSLKMAAWSSLTDDQKTIAQLEDLFMLMQQLLDADAATHRSLDAQLQRQFDADPSDTNKMRLALALTTPGHSRADMLKGQQLIQQLQSKQEALPPVISIYLRTRVTATRQTNALEDKVKTLATDNKDLNDQLEDVRAQIKALTAIEKNLEKANPK
ncbi:MAG: hypothetical protein E6Q40_14385 [Cupriavidus sp.]|nr:MAG: hypothetical protein E6Q40_14385 [Cupriavidus sp.]